jgi:hypothetical protein
MTLGKLSTVLVMAGVMLTRAAAQEPGHGPRSHPPIPGQQFYFNCQIETNGEPKLLEVPLKLTSPMTAPDLDQVIDLPDPLGELRLRSYLPRAKLEQRAVTAEGPEAKPALHISVDGPSQAYQRWLVANDPQHNRLISLIGTWRYMSVDNQEERAELLAQFRDELTRDPTLTISRPDGSAPHVLAVQVGDAETFDNLGCRVAIRAYHPHFAFDRESGKPINRSDKRLNPAVLVEIESGDKHEERWVFERFPEFEQHKGEALPFRVTLDCPVDRARETPDFALVTVGKSVQEMWTRKDGKVVTQRIAPNERIDVTNSPYTFCVTKFLPACRLIEEYAPTEEKGAVTALLVAFTDSAGKPESVWLEAGRHHAITTQKERLTAWFAPSWGGAATPHGTAP